jgi:hypothetical protein
MKKIRTIQAAIAVAIFGAGGARADTPTLPADTLSRLYVGVGAGNSSVYSKFTTFIAQAQPGNETPGSKAIAGRVFAGYTVNHHIALELGFMQTREISAAGSGTHNGADYTAELAQRINGFDYSVLLRPSATGWLHNLFGRVGGTRLTTTNTITATANGQTQEIAQRTQGNGWVTGLGYDYPATRNFALRGELAYYGAISGKSDAQAVWLGLSLIGKF